MPGTDPLAAVRMDPSCLEELVALHQANWTGAPLESVFRLRALVDLSALPTEALLKLAAERAHAP